MIGFEDQNKLNCFRTLPFSRISRIRLNGNRIDFAITANSKHYCITKRWYGVARVGAELVKGSYVIQNGMAVDINHWNTVGASGAVYGILLAFGMIFPNERMFIFPIPVPIKAKLFVIGYAVIELLMARSNDGVAHYAHLGGMLVGLIILLIWTDAGHGGPLEKIRNIFRRKPKNNFHVYRKN